MEIGLLHGILVPHEDNRITYSSLDVFTCVLIGSSDVYKGCGKAMKVIRIRREFFLTPQQREIVELAFAYWLSRFGVVEGSPEDDFYRAQREVMARSSKFQHSTPGLFLVRTPGW